MPATLQQPTNTARHRMPEKPAAAPVAAKTMQSAAPRKVRLTAKASATEATAKAFLMLFKTQPAAVKSRIVALIDEYEDELDELELAAARLAHPEDFDPANSISLDEYLSQRRAKAQHPEAVAVLAA